VIEPSQCKTGAAVWYEPSAGVRFLATIAGEPRMLGQTWVVALSMPTDAYGVWRRFGNEKVPIRRSVPAAALFALTM
jgi:hypothetical protein